MKKIFTLAFAVAATLTATAQNSVLGKAEVLSAERKYKEALEVLQSSFDNPKTTKFGEIYHQAGFASQQIFIPELARAARNQPFDTLNFVTRLDQMVDYFTKSYNAEHTPDAKGKMPKAKFDAQNLKYMLEATNYFYYAGIFYNAKKDYAKAREYFKKHVEFPNNPVLATVKDSLLKANAKNYAETSFNMTLLSYQQKKWEEVLETVDHALGTKTHTRDLYIMKLQSILEGRKDTAAYVRTLKAAIADVPENTNFMNTLVSMYYETNNLVEAEKMAKDFVSADPNNKNAWYVQGVIALNMKRDYKAARESFKKALELDPNFVDANTNMAYAYINEAVTNRQNGKYKYAASGKDKVVGKAAVAQYQKEMAEINKYFSDARPYMEKVRSLSPEDVKRWAPTLSQIYSNLGMRKEALEMDDLLVKSRGN